MILPKILQNQQEYLKKVQFNSRVERRNCSPRNESPVTPGSPLADVNFTPIPNQQGATLTTEK